VRTLFPLGLAGLLFSAGCGGGYGSATGFDLSLDLSVAVDMSATDNDGGPDLLFNPGPSVVITKPAAGTLVGGSNLIVEATITDPIGVVGSSVMAVLGGTNMSVSAMLVNTPGTDSYSGTLNPSKIGTGYVFPNLTVSANDMQGFSGNQGIQLVLDNTPPKMSLSPPTVRFAKMAQLMGGGMGWECSQSFNPVGDMQPVDGQVVPQVFWLRAMIMDRGNYAPGLNIEHFAGVDPASVEIVAMPAPAGAPPLAVHTVGYAGDEAPGGGPGGTECDDLNPMLPASAVKVSMAPIPLQGDADYTPGMLVGDAGTLPFGCDQLGNMGAMAPPKLCGAADPQMYFILPVYLTGISSGVWTIPPATSADPADCVGRQFDSFNEKLPDGPTCVVVHGRDLIGNHTVSQVLRLCINKSGGTTCPGVPTWTTDPTTWPSCTGTYDPVAGSVTPGACSTWGFEDGLVFPTIPGR
jgi:hypothetical protein